MLLRLLIALVLVAGCEKPRSWEPVQVDRKFIEVDSSKLVIRNDTVGEGKFESLSTFVLVDAKNSYDKDLDVTLGGELVDDAGAVVGELAPASLRIPKGKSRLYALLDVKQRHLPTATRARIEVTGASEVGYPPTARIKEFFVHPEGDHILLSGTVLNTGENTIKTVVIGAFYDADDRPMTRPFMVLSLDGGTSHAIHFRSTPGAVKGLLFIGQTVY